MHIAISGNFGGNASKSKIKAVFCLVSESNHFSYLLFQISLVTGFSM